MVVTTLLVQGGAYYYFIHQYGRMGTSSSDLLTVNTLINYGNSTLKWYNETRVPSNWNFYDLTVYITNSTGGNLTATPYASLNEHYVTGINGVANRAGWYWTIWSMCLNENAWAFSKVGVDLVRLTNGETLAWAYQFHPSSMSGEAPTLGAEIVGSC